jgi:hypothetical protein
VKNKHVASNLTMYFCFVRCCFILVAIIFCSSVLSEDSHVKTFGRKRPTAFTSVTALATEDFLLPFDGAGVFVYDRRTFELLKYIPGTL